MKQIKAIVSAIEMLKRREYDDLSLYRLLLGVYKAGYKVGRKNPFNSDLVKEENPELPL